MHRSLLLAGCLPAFWVGLLVSTTLGQGDKPPAGVYATPEEAAADADFALQGEYLGEQLGVQVVALGGGKFTIVSYRGGLPGAGWDGKERQDEDADAATVKELIATAKLKKQTRQSPTLGLKAPAGAVVLFDGTPASLEKHWEPGAKRTADGLLQQGCTSRDQFQDFTLHIEFRLPYMPAARGQGRGNSGLYYQGRYETQMLDSFGLEGKDNECGGLYSIKAPDVNMCLPPLAWQTYDVEFTAARYDAEGKKTAAARVTVRHNGVTVQNNVELPKTTTAAPRGEGADAGPIYLQDHGNPVRYRNVWVLPRNAEQEARRPIVPGFERFYGAAGGDPLAGGRLLLGELNCTACHQASAEMAQRVVSRPAPILDEVGKRVRADYLIEYLQAPHAHKPGTTMPDVLANLPEKERAAAALALTNFLVSTGQVAEQATDAQARARGENFFHQVGCIACHAPRKPGLNISSNTSVPLGALEKKYSAVSLFTFLQDPHRVRPSGRMPRFEIDDNMRRDIAAYLVGETDLRPKNPNARFAAFHGSWSMVPNFDDLKPVRTGECAGLDLNVAGRDGNFGVRFDAFLKIEREGLYTFHLGSDDGSLLFINGKKVVDTDGVHPHTVHSGQVNLKPGIHPLRVDYIQGGGEWTLTLEHEGPGVARQDTSRSLLLTEKGNPPAPAPEPGAKAPFEFDPDQVAAGRALFTKVGCANCHEFKEQGQRLPSTLEARPLAALSPPGGCLAADPAQATALDGPIPQYDLNGLQRAALSAALATPLVAGLPVDQVAQTMTTFNCYACHARGGVGGPETDRNPLFTATIPEMGDEGRLPPPLDGVGDKLNDDYLRHVLQNGANDRPYMPTRMPRFGLPDVPALAQAFIAADRRTGEPAPELPEAEARAKATGRRLVGDKGLGCIKCHTFGQHKATGIQSLNMHQMTRRLRQDWFLRYMVNPQQYRPGTRMPTGFPDGQAIIRDVYNGNAPQQLTAIWSFLSDADKAGIPEGLVADVIELKPEQEPIIYRNFIEGLTPRGIAVGYPEQVHLAWDANRFSLTLLWQGRFMNAGRHWQGRGAGFERPLGDNLIRWEETAPLALLESPGTPWPTQPPKERGYQFSGYRLDDERRPHFLYTGDGLQVEDFPLPSKLEAGPGFARRLTLEATEKDPAKLAQVRFRAAAGKKIERQPDGSYLVDGAVRVRLRGQVGEPVIRDSAGQLELLAPLEFRDGKAQFTQELSW